MKRYWLLVMISSVLIGADPVKPVRGPIEGRLEARRPLVPNPSTLVPADFELMIRVQRSTGNFLVYPGTNEKPGIGTQTGYLASWLSTTDGKFHLFSRQLHATVDVGHAILNLERDLGVSADSIVSGTSWLRTAISLAERAAPDATEWKEASMHDLVELDGFVPGPAFVTPQEPFKIVCAAIPLAALDPLTPPEGSPPSLGNVLEGLLAAVGCGGCTVPCTDNNPCTVGRCQGNYCHWTHLSDVGCTEDGDNCTKDVCNLGQCTHPPDNGAWCETASLCTDGSCFGGECQPVPDNLGGPCENDGDECTLDLCDDFGTCTHPPIVCQPDANLCTNEQCEGGECVSVPVEGSCPPDGNICTDDRCDGGACTYPHNSVPCATDGNVCTDDRCAGGECTHTPNTATCDDGDPCTDNDQCANGSCGGDFCDDQNDCTDNVCTPGGCVFPPNDCDDDNPCTNDACLNGICTHTPNSDSCDDGDSCTRDDYCQAGLCTGTPRDCENGNPCTDSDCTGGGCQHVANSATCADDGNPCTNDVCANGMCTHPFNSGSCDDGDVCTVNDYCQAGECRGEPRDCTDTDPCTINEYCELDMGCRWADFCDDGNPCTVDECNPASMQCAHIDFNDFFGQVPQPFRCSTEGCSINLTPPWLVAVNNDDDNGNGIPDMDEFDAVAGEDDLAVVTIASTGCPPSTCPPAHWEGETWSTFSPTTWFAYQGRTYNHSWDDYACDWDYRFYADANRSASLCDSCPLWPLPDQAYVEGRQPTSACGNPAAIQLTSATICQNYADHHAGCWCLAYEENIIVARVDKLEWRRFQESNVPLDQCPNNGGLRIFPDKFSDSVAEPTRNQVDLVATVQPPIAGMTVYFKVWDVDDPFDQLNNDMPDVAQLDSTPNVGPDNRPTPEPPWTPFVPAVTNAFGEARMTFFVSMQPGNNYRAGASLLQDAIQQATQNMADERSKDSPFPGDSQGFAVPLVWSQMLTVWRKLHVEVDSMGAVDLSNAFPGTINGEPIYSESNSHAVINVGALDSEFDAPNQHYVGRITIAGQGSFVTVATVTQSGGHETVEIKNAPPGIVNAAGAGYELWDDDAGSVPPFVMVGFDAPPLTLPKIPDTGLMAQVFKNAYVEVPPPDLTYYDPTTVFDRNVTTDDEGISRGNANRDLTSTASFWVVHVTSAFQGYAAKDGDPDVELGAQGLQYGITIEQGAWPFAVHSSGSLIFLETIRDHKTGIYSDMLELERYTVAHEAGHQFLLQHSDDRSPPGDTTDPTGDYIMTDVLDDSGMAPNLAFSSFSLKKIRAIPYPPQP